MYIDNESDFHTHFNGYELIDGESIHATISQCMNYEIDGRKAKFIGAHVHRKLDGRLKKCAVLLDKNLFTFERGEWAQMF